MSFSPKDMSLYEFVSTLRKKHTDIFRKLDALKFTERERVKGMKGVVPDTVLECVFCGHHKHSVKWMNRRDLKNVKLPTGSSCFCCVKAAELLGPTRSPQLIEQVGAKALLLEVSSRKRRKLGAQDRCFCTACCRHRHDIEDVD